MIEMGWPDEMSGSGMVCSGVAVINTSEVLAGGFCSSRCTLVLVDKAGADCTQSSLELHLDFMWSIYPHDDDDRETLTTSHVGVKRTREVLIYDCGNIWLRNPVMDPRLQLSQDSTSFESGST